MRYLPFLLLKTLALANRNNCSAESRSIHPELILAYSGVLYLLTKA